MVRVGQLAKVRWQLPPALEMDSPPLQCVTLDETSRARVSVALHAIRAPLVPLDYVRPDLPNIRIFLKLETLQPAVRSFKVRGASNAIFSRRDDLDAMDEKLVVTASVGNMGRAVAHACRAMGYRCIVVVPDSAPRAKVDAVAGYGADVVRVPYDTWWEIIETCDCASLPEIGLRPHVFVHPVCDPAVVAGNSTCGAEILEDMPDVDAIFIPYGGGGLCCGIGSAVLNDFKREVTVNGGPKGQKCAVVSCEPETAAPMALSKECGMMMSFREHYEPSFCDGCGGKSLLKPMWPLANEVIDSSLAVPLEGIEAGVWALHELNGVVAEGAGGVTVGAAMLCPLQRLGNDALSWKKVVCVVSGAGIDRSKLSEIIGKYDSVRDFSDLVKRLNWSVRGSTSAMSPTTGRDGSPAQHSVALSRVTQRLKQLRVLSEAEILVKLPMHKCIDAAKDALIALSTKSGIMPLRQVNKLPKEEINKTGFLVTMPSYYGGYAACKLITVYPNNSDSGYSSHQGVVALFHAKNHGELLLLADAHVITAQRTAAASAAATKALASSESRVLALLGTGEQARSHFVSMLETGLSIGLVRLWGRNTTKAEQLEQELRDTAKSYHWENWPGRQSADSIDFEVCTSVKECVRSADIICTLVPSSDPILLEEWVKPGAHINAVGACLPTSRELDGACIKKAALYCDSAEACFVEAGDIVMSVKEGVITKDHLKGEIGAVLNGDLVGRENEQEVTLFKSLGIALEDLTAAKTIFEMS